MTMEFYFMEVVLSFLNIFEMENYVDR